MPFAAAARTLSGAAASTSGASIAGSASCRRAARGPASPPNRSPAAAAAPAAAVDARPLTQPRPPRRRLIVSASASSSSSQPPPPQLFGPPPFDPAKLTVTRLPGVDGASRTAGGNGAAKTTSTSTSTSTSTPKSPPPSSSCSSLFPLPRRYTLTHNDVTGALALSIGPNYNSAQLEGWYVRMIRDEVLAEWRVEEGGGKDRGEAEGAESVEGDDGRSRSAPPPPASSANSHSLHIFCHVSGDARWLAPPRLRSRIFQREMALVLDTITHADADLLRKNPGLQASSVVVHLRSHVASLDARLVWGTLGDRRGWREPPRLLEGLLEGVVSDLWRELGGGTELRADSFSDSDGSDFDGVGLSSSSSAASADFYYDSASSSSSPSRSPLNDEEMDALMSDDSFIAMAERDTVDDDDEEDEESEGGEQGEGAGTRSSRKGSAVRI